MAPIPNPEDMDPIERVEVYGTRYEPPRQRSETSRDPRPVVATQPRHQRAVRRQPNIPQVARPAGPVIDRPAHPEASKERTRPPSPVVAARPPAPVIDAPQAAKPASPQTKAEKLGARLAPELASGSTLDIPPAIAAGEEGVVVLTLPNGFLDRVRQHAAALGLGLAARAVDIRARLIGPGYVIVPDETQTARLQESEPTSFSWQVTPQAGDKGPLTAEINGELRGAAKPVPFPLTSVGETLVDRAQIPEVPLVTVPGFGPVRSGLVVLVGLALLAVILLAAFGRRARERRRAAQRQRAREARADFSPGDKAKAIEEDASPSGARADSADTADMSAKKD
jgi:hypothetical protein